VGVADANPSLASAASRACRYLGMVEGLKAFGAIAGSATTLAIALPRTLAEGAALLPRVIPAPGDLVLAIASCWLFTASGSLVTSPLLMSSFVGARAPPAERLAG